MDRRQVVLLGLLMGAIGCSKGEDASSASLTRTRSEPLEVSEPQKIQATDGRQGQRFGDAVAIGPTHLFVAAPELVSGTHRVPGAVYAFERAGSSFPQRQKILADDGTQPGAFGIDIAASGSTLIVGSTAGFSGGLGSAYVFTFTGSSWSQQQKLVPADDPSSLSFGGSLAIDGDTAFVASQQGIYVFVRSAGVWSQTQKLGRPSSQALPGLAVSGDTLLVGRCDPDVTTTPCLGAAFVYVRSGGQWVEQQKLVPTPRVAGDAFGGSVAISGDTALVGASATTVSGQTVRGAVHVFVRSGGVFAERQLLVAGDGTTFDSFGWSVALDGNVAVVSAPFHEHGGVNQDHGAAYVFVRTAQTFVAENELRATDAQNSDLFGWSLAFSGGLALVGAPNDDGPFVRQGSAHVFSFQGANGQSCTLSSDCSSGFCSDGRCCNSACDGACDACSIATGATRDGECALVGGSSPGAATCAPLTCNGQSPACARCAGDAECSSSTYCDASGACQPRRELGRACEPVFDCNVSGCRVCASGHCVDGVCCNEACTSGCSSCSALVTGVSSGTCAPVPAGTDPKNACVRDPGFPNSCGADGECGGNGACRTAAPAGTRCGNLTCESGTASEFACNALGQCVANSLECGGGTGGSGGSGAGGSGTSGGSGGSGTGGTSGTGGSGGTGGTSGTGGSGGTGGTGGGDACIRVSLDGDDALALANDGATPFRNLQPAIDFAAANPTIADDVCVALGAYDGPEGAPLAMRNGVSVTGGYDSATWTRLVGFVSRIRPRTAEGILFPSDIDEATALDAFIVEMPLFETASGVIVDGASGAELVNVSIDLSLDVTLDPRLRSYGVDVRNGGAVTITSSAIVAECTLECAGLRSSGGRVVFLDGSIEVGNPFGSDIDFENVLSIADLVDSPGSHIEASELRLHAPGSPLCQLLGITVAGNSAGTVVAGNSLVHSIQAVPAGTGISFTECGGSGPTIVDNLVDSALVGIVTGPGCPALVDGNEVHTVGSANTTAIGIDCQDGCTILNNEVDCVNNARSPGASGSVNAGIGVTCSDCLNVSGNDLAGLVNVACTRNCEFTSRGLVLTGSGTLVDANTIVGGCSHGLTGGGGSIGVIASGGHRLQNNVITGGRGCQTTQPEQDIAIAYGLSVSGPVDVHSNLIQAGETVAFVCTSASIVGGGGSLIRNNVLVPSNCSVAACLESGVPGPAMRLENNAFAPGRALYRINGAADPQTIQDVNALPGSSNNFLAACPFPINETSACVDAGTPTGAPDHDLNGNPRSATSPDVGPEEWGDLPD